MRSIGMAILFMTALAAAGCNGQEKPKNLIAEDTYIDILVEIQLAENYRDSLPADSVAYDSLTARIFDEYGVTEEQFRTSHNYYRDQLAGQTERLNEAIERLRKDREKRSAGDTTASG